VIFLALLKIERKMPPKKKQVVAEKINAKIEVDTDTEESENDSEDSAESDVPDVANTKQHVDTVVDLEDQDQELEVVHKEKEPIRKDYKIIVVKKENRITSDLMSAEEMTEAISERIRQLEKESIAFVDVSDLSDPASIAKREIMQRKCPLILRRCIGYTLDENGTQTSYYEYWDVNEMQHYLSF
jgi:hypothetical protein